MRAGEICCDEYGMEEMNANIMNQLSNECLHRKYLYKPLKFDGSWTNCCFSPHESEIVDNSIDCW